jgi:hypothetical protein
MPEILVVVMVGAIELDGSPCIYVEVVDPGRLRDLHARLTVLGV